MARRTKKQVITKPGKKVSVPELPVFDLKKITDIVLKAIVTAAAATVIALAYTGLRAVTGMDKKMELTPQANALPTAVPTPVPTAAPTKPIPARYSHFFRQVKTKEEIPKIHLEEAKALFESGKALFIDTRGRSEYNVSHIPGAINMGVGEVAGMIPQIKEELDGKVLVSYCHGAGCHLSDKVAYSLYEAGYKKVAIYFGGWPEWTDAKMPVENYRPPEQYRRLFEEAASAEEIVDINLEEAKFLYDNMLANFIDVDYPDKYDAIRIDRAVNIPVDKLDEMLSGYAGYLNRKPAVVYCHGTGRKSKIAAEKMYQAGYKKVLRFVPALPQWEEAKYPIYKKQGDK
ncbi:MAG: rhodanese-like domain-containing protein [Spirochaetia bacterium]|nr:rhodanese-like domain-containing protein [Spirochaetia bacterium]